MKNSVKILILTYIYLTFVITILTALNISMDTNNDGKDDRWLQLTLYKDWQKLNVNKNDEADESCFYISDKNKIYFIENEQFDYSGKGKPDIFITNKIDGNNFFTEINADSNSDGKIDMIVYKKNDWIYKKITANNNDGKFDQEEYYNEKNKRIKLLVDSNKDGKMDDTYLYEDELLQKEELDTNFDGIPDMWVIFKYNADNSMKECIIEKDNNYDEKVDEWHYTDEKRRVIRIEKDTNFDGKVDSINKLM